MTQEHPHELLDEEGQFISWEREQWPDMAGNGDPHGMWDTITDSQPGDNDGAEGGLRAASGKAGVGPELTGTLPLRRPS